MDVNIVIITGTLVTHPSWFPLANNKRALIFTIRNQEHFKLSDGRMAHHNNHINIEVLGKNAERCFEELKPQLKYQITGYLRVDEINGLEKLRVRAFRVEEVYGHE